jgi:hypothetical protein
MTIQMAHDLLSAGHTLIAQCGPLQVQATLMYVDEIQFTLWNTETCADVCLVANFVQLDTYLSTFGSFASGAWTIYAPDEGDDSQQ